MKPVIIAAAFAVVLAATSAVTQEAPAQDSRKIAADTDWPQGAINGYYQGCSKQKGASQQYCGCTAYRASTKIAWNDQVSLVEEATMVGWNGLSNKSKDTLNANVKIGLNCLKDLGLAQDVGSKIGEKLNEELNKK